MEPKQKNEVFAMLSLIGQIAITMLVPIGALTAAGWWLGEKTGFPALSVAGFLIGAVAGYQSVYRIVKKYLKNRDPYSLTKDMARNAGERCEPGTGPSQEDTP